MRILGLMMVRNGGARLRLTLESMSVFCDDIYILNDRSQDETGEILRSHPKVTNVFTADSFNSQADWHHPESMNLNFLYRMADFYAPDWVVLVDHDEIVEPADKIRDILASFDKSVSGLKVSRISVWNDLEYPLMVPLMSPARSLQGNIWRYYPGLTPGAKRLHNRRFPNEIDNLGRIATTDQITYYHYGWDTLRKRIDKVDQYTALDPRCEYNFGVPYDRGLLFGYERHAIDKLVEDYLTRYAEHQ